MAENIQNEDPSHTAKTSREDFEILNEMDKGVQPFDKIMTELGLSDADLVNKSTNNLTFRMVAKGRKGRRIKLRTQSKILTTLNACSSERKFSLEDLFNYMGTE